MKLHDKDKEKVVALSDAFEAFFPPHKASFSITHNQHLDYYQTVQQSVEEADNHGYAGKDWISEEEKQKAIATNECWTVQWYPDTPVGFHLASASTLSALLVYFAEQLAEDEPEVPAVQTHMESFGWRWDENAMEFRKNDTGEEMDDFYATADGTESWDELHQAVFGKEFSEGE